MYPLYLKFKQHKDEEVDVVYHRRGFAALLTVVTFVPPFISLCGAFHSFYCAMKDAPEPGSSRASASEKDHAADPEASPKSPLAKGAPPHDEEQPVVITE